MFDRIAITAADEAQARSYREMLRAARVRAARETSVVADPGEGRVGSLGATVNLLRTGAVPLRGRALVVHSGGDARRIPSYAAMGKAFIPMRDGRSLLEHIVESMDQLPLPGDGGLLVVAGDVLPGFDLAGLDFSRPGVTGVAFADNAAEARRHGVYMVDGARVLRGAGNGAVPVAGFLQKPDVHEGTHLIDTGVMFIDWPTAEKMVSLPIEGDIYDEFPKMLLGGFAPFSVNVAGRCDFFHVGSTRELLDNLGDGRAYVDCVGCKLTLAGDNVVTNVPPGRFRALRLGRGECFTCVPYGRGEWLDLKYRIDDNFKADGLWESSGLGGIIPRVDARRLLEVRRWAGWRSAPRLAMRGSTKWPSTNGELSLSNVRAGARPFEGRDSDLRNFD